MPELQSYIVSFLEERAQLSCFGSPQTLETAKVKTSVSYKLDDCVESIGNTGPGMRTSMYL